MKEVFTAYMIRIFGGGLICTVAMMLTGGGAKKEIVRLCCVCIMVIFILTPVKGADIDFESLFSIYDTKDYVNDTVEKAADYQYSAIAGNICGYISENAEKLGIKCLALLDYEVDENNVFTINAITIRHHPADEQALSSLREMIASDCGITYEQMTFIEVGD